MLHSRSTKDERLWRNILSLWKKCKYYHPLGHCLRGPDGYKFKALTAGLCQKNRCPFLGMKDGKCFD